MDCVNIHLMKLRAGLVEGVDAERVVPSVLLIFPVRVED